MNLKSTLTCMTLIVSLILLTTKKLYAQNNLADRKIMGFISDSASQKKLDFITVNLMTDKNTVVKVDYTKEDGSFSFSGLKPVRYQVIVVGVGYKNKMINADLSDSTRLVLNLETITLSQAALGLKEVKITAAKPLVTQEVDRLSYDLQADPESKVNSVLDMMRKVPLLSVDADNTVYLKGNSDFKILINGKPSSMMERSYKDVLRSMPASSIERIEVITTPPAKYDAEGLAGIINIITNRKIDNGYNGSLNLSEKFPNGGPGLGGSFSARFGKLGMSAFGGASSFNAPLTTNSALRNTFGIEPTTLLQNGTNQSDSKNAYLGYEITYEIDTLNLLSAQLNINGSKSNGVMTQNSSLQNTEDILQNYMLRNLNNGNGSGMDAAVNYQKGFRADKNRLLTFSYRIFSYGNKQRNNIAFSERLDYNMPDYRQLNDQRFSEQTFQIDYVYPVKKLNIEAGIKAIFRDNKSDFQNWSLNNENDQFEIQPGLGNKYRNEQNVFGAYNTYQFSTKKWTFKGGARIEQTVINADFISSESSVNQNYFNVIPSVSVNRKLKGNSALNLGFTQRIQRPGIYQLNPFVDRSNPNFERTGNPNLKPSNVNDIQLAYNWSKKMSINFGVGYSFFKDLIFPVSVYDSVTNITRTSYGNTGTAKLPQSNLNINYPITKKWNFSLNARVAYGMVKGIVNDVLIKNEGLMYQISTSTGYRFDKDWRVNANLNANGPSVSLQGTSNAMVSTSFSVNKDIIKDKLSLSAAVNNPFTKYRYNRNESNGPDFAQVNNRRDYFRSFNFSVNYKFGKLKDAIKKNKRGIRNDDVQSGN